MNIEKINELHALHYGTGEDRKFPKGRVLTNKRDLERASK